MKKFLKWTFINIFIFIIIFLAADFIYFQVIFHHYKSECIKNNISVDKNLKYKFFYITGPKDNKTTNVYKYFLENKHYHPPIIAKNEWGGVNGKTKAPILLFGDSYTWLNPDDGLQGNLSNYTHRTVFNFAFWGWGAQHTYYLINNPLLYKIIDEVSEIPPEYAVYTYIRDHKNRLSSVMDYYLDIEPYLTYEINNNKLQIKKYNFFQKLLFRSFIFKYVSKKNQQKSDKESYDELYNLVSQSYFELKKHYPNIKYIVFEYYQEKDVIEEEDEFFKKLEKIGIKVISSRKLTKEDLYDKKYTEDDGYHPNTKAWQIISKPLAKEIEKY